MIVSYTEFVIMKNTLADLNGHLFAQLERLGDEDLNPEELAKEVTRADAITTVSKEIVSNAALQVKAVQLQAEYGAFRPGTMPALLGVDKK